SVYSTEGYASCHVSWRAGQTNAGVMVGLNSDPATDNDYTSIDYAWYTEDTGDLHIFESGGYVAPYGADSTTADLAVTYDGHYVRYWRDNALVRVVSAPGLTLHLDSAFFTSGAAINQLTFAGDGPATLVLPPTVVQAQTLGGTARKLSVGAAFG